MCAPRKLLIGLESSSAMGFMSSGGGNFNAFVKRELPEVPFSLSKYVAGIEAVYN